MAVIDDGKRKASELSDAPSSTKRMREDSLSDPPSPINPNPTHIDTIPEKPAVTEERQNVIEFRVVNNDGSAEGSMILTGLKNIFQRQLPKMPKDYIARLVYDRTHISMAIVKPTRDANGDKLPNGGLEVVGGITYRPFITRGFAEIVFCAISSDQQVKGYGSHLMSHLKDYVKASTMSTTPNPHPDNHNSDRPEGRIMHFLTYADNNAIGYFRKQGFTKDITLERPRWMGYIKDYEGGTIMQCSMVPRVSYLTLPKLLLKQKALIHAKIERVSKSHIVHEPPKAWRDGVHPIDPLTIPAIKASGWSPDMDALSRAPRHGPNYNALLHLLNDLQNNNSAWPFQQPVNKDEVLDYYDVIKEPMDLSTMETKLEKDEYAQVEDFVRDVLLICRNCRKYNSEGTSYAKLAIRLEKFLWRKIREVPEWSHLEPESFKE